MDCFGKGPVRKKPKLFKNLVLFLDIEYHYHPIIVSTITILYLLALV
jgi:hypothetical protein